MKKERKRRYPSAKKPPITDEEVRALRAPILDFFSGASIGALVFRNAREGKRVVVVVDGETIFEANKPMSPQDDRLDRDRNDHDDPHEGEVDPK